MSSTHNTGLGTLTALRQICWNLDAQRDQLLEAIERDHPSGTPGHEQAHRELIDVFTEIAHAREHLVDAHNLLRDIVSPIDMMREVRK